MSCERLNTCINLLDGKGGVQMLSVGNMVPDAFNSALANAVTSGIEQTFPISNAIGLDSAKGGYHG